MIWLPRFLTSSPLLVLIALRISKVYVPIKHVNLAMSTNAIMSCDWPSAKALVEDIHAEELNVTNVVAKCVNVCDLTLESKRSVRI